jgi:L-iditol 2-dehydrogenase
MPVKAAVLTEPNKIMLATVADPAAGPGDLVIRVRVATICGTDIRIFRGRKTAGVRYPSILGHEFAGEVVETGGHPALSVGDRVGVCPAISCGQCFRCKNGMENLCAEGANVGYEIDGAFAELIRIPAAAVRGGNVRHLPSHMSFAEAAIVEPFACVINGQNKVNVSSADTVVVVGAGPIGQLHVRLARLRGATRIIVSDPNAARRAAALQSGADVVIDPAAEDVTARVRAETGGRGARVVICAIGVPALARQSTDLAAHGGRISLFAGFSKGQTAEMDVNAIHYNEQTVTGAFGLSRRDFDLAFDLVASGRFDVKSLVTHRYTLDEAVSAESGEAIKVAILNE